MPRPARILVVCTGNLCRSPMLAGALDLTLNASRDEPLARVRSAGTSVEGLLEPNSRTAAVLAGFGSTAPVAAPRPLVAREIAEADLILVAGRKHRAAVATLSPLGLRTVMTMLQATHILRLMLRRDEGAVVEPSSEALRSIITEMLMLRGHEPFVRPEDDEVLDPVGAEIATFRASFAQMRPIVDNLQILLGLPPRLATGGPFG